MSTYQGFAVWITGLPSSGKSSICQELVKKLKMFNVPLVVLESDEMRKIITPEATYSLEERNRFYRILVFFGDLITRNRVNVIFDATGNKRQYRDHARSLIPKFIEAYIQCPIDVCTKRDPKGIYRRAAAGQAVTVPGVQVPYEVPINPEITLDGQDSTVTSADSILRALKRLKYI